MLILKLMIVFNLKLFSLSVYALAEKQDVLVNYSILHAW